MTHCDCPPHSQGTVYAELAFGFLFFVAAKLPSQLTSKPQEQLWSGQLSRLSGSQSAWEDFSTCFMWVCSPHPVSFWFKTTVISHLGQKARVAYAFDLTWNPWAWVKYPTLWPRKLVVVCPVPCPLKKHPHKRKHAAPGGPFYLMLCLCPRVSGQKVCCARPRLSKWCSLWRNGATCGRGQLWALLREEEVSLCQGYARESDSQTSR